jgi:hypothetical protein
MMFHNFQLRSLRILFRLFPRLLLPAFRDHTATPLAWLRSQSPYSFFWNESVECNGVFGVEWFAWIVQNVAAGHDTQSVRISSLRPRSTQLLIQPSPRHDSCP